MIPLPPGGLERLDRLKPPKHSSQSYRIEVDNRNRSLEAAGTAPESPKPLESILIQFESGCFPRMDPFKLEPEPTALRLIIDSNPEFYQPEFISN